MGIILGEIMKALGYLLMAYIIFYAYKIPNDEVKKGNLKTVLWKGFLYCAAIGLIMSVNMGSPTCTDSEQDTRGTTCNEYADDGYEPTNEERAGKFAYYMTLFYIPVIIGALSKANYLKD